MIRLIAICLVTVFCHQACGQFPIIDCKLTCADINKGDCPIDSTWTKEYPIDCRTTTEVVYSSSVCSIDSTSNVLNRIADNACRIYLLAGQSNMVGKGEISEVTDPSILVSNPILQRYRFNSFQNYDPNVANRFGPELGIYESLLNDPNAAKTYYIKEAYGATQISLHMQGGTLYDNIIEEYENGIAAVKEDGCTNPYLVYFWYQGGSDAANQTNYDSLFRIHYTDLIQTLGTDLHFVATQNAERNADYTAVNDVFRNFADSLANFDFVEIEYTTANYIDAVHIGTEAQLEVGRQYYEIAQDNCGSLVNENIEFP